ncbi:MAG: Gfo/Idh/MocA family oxidoreductase [Acidobacteriaceae bacterium]|nr:Gfo/Idh/MocA family oxidoreductase [Acidobacteriaceae bacterium]
MSNVDAKHRVRWGVLGAAAIGLKKVIPAMQKSELCDIVALASRDRHRARNAADQLKIAKSYGSYEELLADPDIDAVYNPLPNHLHVPWTKRAAEAGKHVLCEKPISLTAAEARELIAVRDKTGVKIGEAFMVYTHPQWLRARELVQSGAIGELRAILGAFSYFNRDPKNIRNIPKFGGGGLMDIGCYPITMSRFLFGREPERVVGLLDFDPELGTDRLSSAMLDFGIGHAVFTCSTQLVPFQRIQILGTKARIEVEIPFNAPPDRPCRIFIDDGSELAGRNARIEEFPVCDQYTLQGDAFSRAAMGEGEVAVPLENAIGNMAVIEALFRSAKNRTWEQPRA